MRELTMIETRELTMDEMLLVSGGADADRQVPDPSHGMSQLDKETPLYN
ncbi:MAG: hypothetical protein ACXWAC_09345 [Usitatibacter sp.]